MRLQLAEGCGELLLLLRRHVLVAEEQHLVLHPKGSDLGRESLVLADIGDVRCW